MYEDLARTQRAGLLELVVARLVIPSLLTSFVMQCRDVSGSPEGMTYLATYDCHGGPMRALSSVASLSIHAAIGAALLVGTTKPARPSPPATTVIMPWADPPEESRQPAPGTGITTPVLRWTPLLPPPIPLPADLLQSGASMNPAVYAAPAPGTVVAAGAPSSGWVTLESAGPQVLVGPLPRYPELLRQAGLEGQVVLEARVDSTGRVQSGSIEVVSASHPGFVEPARQALAATLFRPGRVGGRAVAMLIRVPFAFSIRSGTGRAR